MTLYSYLDKMEEKNPKKKRLKKVYIFMNYDSQFDCITYPTAHKCLTFDFNKIQKNTIMQAFHNAKLNKLSTYQCTDAERLVA